MIPKKILYTRNKKKILKLDIFSKNIFLFEIFFLPVMFHSRPRFSTLNIG